MSKQYLKEFSNDSIWHHGSTPPTLLLLPFLLLLFFSFALRRELFCLALRLGSLDLTTGLKEGLRGVVRWGGGGRSEGGRSEGGRCEGGRC